MNNFTEALRNSRYVQYLAMLSASFGAICSTMTLSWGSPSLPKLTLPNSPIGVILNNDQAAWVASIPMLGFIVGSQMTQILLNNFGPKRSLLIAAIPFTISWIGIVFTKSVVVLIVLRFLSGIGSAIAIIALPVYIGEIADKNIRGKLCTISYFVGSFGDLIALSIGPFVKYETLAMMGAAVTIIFASTFTFFPDSPYYLVKSGKDAESIISLRRLLSKNVDDVVLHERMKEIQLTVKSNLEKKCCASQICSKKNYRIAIFLMLNMKFIAAFEGMTVMKSYFQTIIHSTTSSISAETSSIIFAFAMQPSVLLSAFLIDKIGRRILFIISTLGCAVTLGIEGAYFYLHNVMGADLSIVSWLPTLCLSVFLFLEPFGIAAVVPTIMSEIFAHDIKIIASTLGSTFHSCLSFFLSMSFLPISEVWGTHVMFWVFSAACFYGTIFATFLLPETKGKTFLEIQNMLTKK